MWLGALEDDHRTPIRFQTIRRRSADDDESHCKNATLWLRPEQTRHRCCACGKRTRKPGGCTARGSKAVTALEHITRRPQIRKESELSIAIPVKMDRRTLPHGPGLGHLEQGPRAVVTNRGWDTNDFLPCGKARATCGDSAGRQEPHTLTWFCGGSCGLQFVSRPTAYQHMKSPHEQTARQCETANQRFVSKLMMANESSKLSF